MSKRLLGAVLMAALCAACADGGGGSAGGGSGSTGGGSAASGGGASSSGGGTSSAGGGASSTGGGSGVDTSTVSASVSTSGGTVTHATGAAVTVPASALASAVTVSITGSAAPGTSELGARAVGQAFVLAPEGQTFLKPISLKVPYDPAQLGGAAASQLRLRIAPMGSTAFSELETTVDEQAHTLSASTTHFSVVAPAVGSANPILITTASLPDGVVGTDYGFTLAVSGGTKPYAFSSPKLPQGLFVDATTGRIYGAPAAGQYAFTIVVADASSPVQRAEKAFSVTIVGGGSGGGGGSSGGGAGGGSSGGGSAGGGSAGGGSA
ncbi:MAG: Ig domain-containing protein, partial [Myxococcaceae bacterium]|nr:Ig domain-containing protein [Myxococcaceae bacterium]